MQTDPNTVLPLSSSTSNNSIKLAPVSKENGLRFERDFNKAQSDLEPKRLVASESKKQSSVPETKTSFFSQSEAPKDDEKNATSAIDGERLPLKSTSESLDSSASDTDVSGKVLQLNGDLSPVSDTDLKLIKDDVSLSSAEALSSVSTHFVEGADKVASPLIAHDIAALWEEKVDVGEVILSVDSQATVGLSDDSIQFPLTSDLVSDADSHIDSSDLIHPNIEADMVYASQIVDVDDQFLVGLMARSDVTVPTTNTMEFSELAVSNAASTSRTDPFNGAIMLNSDTFSDFTEDSVESVLTGSDGSQLSWVLSQMDASIPKVTSMNLEAGITLDSTKVGAPVASLLAASMNESVSSDSILNSSLSNSAVVSEEIIADSFLNEESILIDEPIEFRKKELEAIIARMSAQMDGRAVDSNDTGGLNSSLQNHGVNRLASAVNVSVASINNPQSNLTMNLPPSHPGWADEMSQKVAWLARDGGHTAHIRLDPPELGSLTVKISVDNDANTQVSFLAATPQSRDLLESQMSRLRDMLAQQGMDLSKADVDVSQQDASGTQRQTEHEARQNRNDFSSDEEEDELILNNSSYVSASGVDYYA